MRSFTRDDEMYMLRHYRSQGPTKVARAIGFTPQAVKSWAKENGVVCDLRPGLYALMKTDSVQLCNHHAVDVRSCPTPDEIAARAASIRAGNYAEMRECVS